MSCKPVLKIKSTEEYEALDELFARNGAPLCYSEKTEIVHAWALTHGGGALEALIGGLVLVKEREAAGEKEENTAMKRKQCDRYFIKSMALDRLYRGMKLSKILLDKACDEVRMLGGRELAALAEEPQSEFFKHFGFQEGRESEKDRDLHLLVRKV